jgi:hypothetical protein
VLKLCEALDGGIAMSIGYSVEVMKNWTDYPASASTVANFLLSRPSSPRHALTSHTHRYPVVQEHILMTKRWHAIYMKQKRKCRVENREMTFIEAYAAYFSVSKDRVVTGVSESIHDIHKQLHALKRPVVVSLICHCLLFNVLLLVQLLWHDISCILQVEQDIGLIIQQKGIA